MQEIQFVHCDFVYCDDQKGRAGSTRLFQPSRRVKPAPRPALGVSGEAKSHRAAMYCFALVPWVGVSACGAESPAATSTEGGRGVIRCTVPTPRNWERDGVVEAFKTAGELSGWVCLPDQVEWWHAAGKGYRSAKVFQSQRWQNVLLGDNPAGRTRVFIQLDPYPPPRHGTLAAKLPSALKAQTFASPAVREAFVTEAVARVRWYDAQYVCLAMEINAYYEQQPADFDNFVSLFAEAREAIKKIKPDAVVFVSFQYEQLLGRFGGIAGQTVHEPHWELLEKFEPHQDAVGISSYPLASMTPPRFGDPKDLPDNYYSRIAKHTDKPIVFCELGWPSGKKYGGSEESQAQFLRRFGDLTSELDLVLVNYFFLYDTKGYGSVFDSMGLLDASGRPRKGFHVWKTLWSGN